MIIVNCQLTDRERPQGAAADPREAVGRDEGADRPQGCDRGAGEAPRGRAGLRGQLRPQTLPHGAHPHVLLPGMHLLLEVASFALCWSGNIQANKL